MREESMHWKASLPADSSASRASHPAREGPSRTTHAQQAASRSGPVAQQSASSASADNCAIATPPRRQGSRLCGHPRRAVAMPAPAVAGSHAAAPTCSRMNRPWRSASLRARGYTGRPLHAVDLDLEECGLGVVSLLCLPLRAVAGPWLPNVEDFKYRQCRRGARPTVTTPASIYFPRDA